MNNRTKIIGSIWALSGALLVSTKAVIVKLAYQHDVDSASLLMLRMLFSLPFFTVIAWHTLSKNPEKLEALKNPWPIALYGLMGYYLASFFDLAGLQYIDAGLERIILFTYPSIVLLLTVFWLKEKITLPQVIAIIITFAGIGIAYLGNVSINQGPNMVKGAMLILLAAITFSIYYIGSQKWVAHVGTRLYNSAAMIIAAIAIIIHNSLVNGFNLFSFSAPVYWYALLMATVATVIPSFMIVEGIRVIGAKNSSIISTIGPISTIILAAVFLGEKVNTLQWIGTLIVIGGILFLMLKRKKK
ncbi:MAG: DMT family transporter [Bacteroidota bacterium]